MSKKKTTLPALATAPENGDLTADELLTLHAAQGNALEEQAQRIEELERKIAAQAASRKPAGGNATSVGAQEYRVVHGLIVNGKKLTPAEIAQDTELCERLAAGNSSALQKI